MSAQPPIQQPSIQSLGGIAVVVVRPKGAGNLGAIARAMGHFGFQDLRLVAPRCNAGSLEARAMAMSAHHLLTGAAHYATLREATRDCDWILAASRRRGRKRSSTMNPREGAPALLARAEEGRLALVFGPEDKGLRTDETDLCQEQMLIPAEPGGGSINLAQAALLVMWELYAAARERPGAKRAARTNLASREEVEGLLDHMRETFEYIGFLPHFDPDRVTRTFRRLLDRAEPDSRDVRMIRGVFRQLSWKVDRIGPPIGASGSAGAEGGGGKSEAAAGSEERKTPPAPGGGNWNSRLRDPAPPGTPPPQGGLPSPLGE